MNHDHRWQCKTETNFMNGLNAVLANIRHECSSATQARLFRLCVGRGFVVGIPARTWNVILNAIEQEMMVHFVSVILVIFCLMFSFLFG